MKKVIWDKMIKKIEKNNDKKDRVFPSYSVPIGNTDISSKSKDNE